MWKPEMGFENGLAKTDLHRRLCQDVAFDAELLERSQVANLDRQKR